MPRRVRATLGAISPSLDYQLHKKNPDLPLEDGGNIYPGGRKVKPTGLRRRLAAGAHLRLAAL